MIYLFLGTEQNLLRKKAHGLIEKLQTKRPDTELFSLNEDNFSFGNLEELSAGSGLFDPKHIVFADNIFGTGMMEEKEIKAILPAMKSSESIFVLLETKLLAPQKKVLEKHSEKIIEQDEKEKKKEDFNIFAITDALLHRDKIKLWSLYLEALASGKSPEEVHGLLFWQARAIAQAQKGKSAKNSGLKPFVYTKSQKAQQKYSSKEIEQMPRSLMHLIHTSRLQSEDLRVSLERFILSI